MPSPLPARLPLVARLFAGLGAIGFLCGSVVVSCSGDPRGSTGGSGANAPASQSMGRWTPTAQDTCTQAFHDTFFVIGPDGKKYPTWHAPEERDPDTGDLCSFGHDHGTDPRSSALWPSLQRHFAFDANRNGLIDSDELDVSGVPFGLVSEQLVGSNTPRLEDHVGYKILWSNNVARGLVGGGAFDLRCDLFTAYNQPTATADPFASNMFSVTYAIDCNNGSSLSQFPVTIIASLMAVYGNPGFITLDTNGTQLDTGTAADPATSPQGQGELGRLIPVSSSVFDKVFVATGATSDFGALAERWETQLRLLRSNGTELATLNPSFVVADPARYWITGLAESINLCYFGLNASGNLVTDPLQASTVVRQARGATCALVAPNGPATPASNRLPLDDPDSPFRGCRRSASFGADVLNNPGNTDAYYTDAFGGNVGTVAFAGSIKQFVSKGDSGSVTLAPVTAERQDCASPRVHAPN